jgi:hypothetical protein
VQQFGAVYERILQHGLTVEDGSVVVAENPAARKSSGSYYTPEELVALIIGHAVRPMVSAHLAGFAAKVAVLARDTRARDARLADLLPLDPASLLLDLKICDPAMGSGHFLVSLVDWLADRVLDAMAEASAAVSFAAYKSPLAGRIEAIRTRILAAAKTRGLRRRNSTIATSSAEWCSSASSMASTRTRWPSNSPRWRCGCIPSRSAHRCRSSIITCAAATALSVRGHGQRWMR